MLENAHIHGREGAKRASQPASMHPGERSPLRLMSTRCIISALMLNTWTPPTIKQVDTLDTPWTPPRLVPLYHVCSSLRPLTCYFMPQCADAASGKGPAGLAGMSTPCLKTVAERRRGPPRPPEKISSVPDMSNSPCRATL